jgi:hypothetical protein
MTTVWVAHKLPTLEVGMVMISMKGGRWAISSIEGGLVSCVDLVSGELTTWNAARRAEEWTYMIETTTKGDSS